MVESVYSNHALFSKHQVVPSTFNVVVFESIYPTSTYTNSTIHLSSACRFCAAAIEDRYHFLVGCPCKWQYWSDATHDLGLTTIDISASNLYCILTSLHTTTGAVVNSDLLELIGAILEALWKYHWSCTINQSPWIPTAAIGLLQSSMSLKLTRIDNG